MNTLDFYLDILVQILTWGFTIIGGLFFIFFFGQLMIVIGYTLTEFVLYKHNKFKKVYKQWKKNRAIKDRSKLNG